MHQVSKDLSPYQISIVTDVDVRQLKHSWLDIEKRSDTPFFLSWAWISTWIHTYTPQLYLIKAELEHQTVALGLLTSSTERRHFVINAKQLRLHQTGLNSEDQIWVEYNNFICLDNHKEHAVSACLAHLINSPIFHVHDEIIISMISHNNAKTINNHLPNCEILFTRPCYSVNFDTIKEKNVNYLQTLASNTRYQIRRSIRHYEKTHGSLELVHTNSSEDALKFFDETAPFHIERWYDSGFINQDFIKFHHALIKSYYDEGRIHLIKVNAGETTIAILYYLIKDTTVSFYLQGLHYEDNKMLKPGLVAHTLATQYFMDKGMKIYDYMGGFSQYKTQLASKTEDLATLRIQKPILKFILENTAQTLKNIVIRNP